MGDKIIKSFDDGFIGTRPQNHMINDLTMDFSQDGLDINFVGDLIKVLKRKYPKDDAIIKLGEALGLEPKRERSKKGIVRGNRRLKADFAKNNQTKPQGATGVTDSGGGKTAANIEKHAPNDFYRAVGRIAVCFLNIK